MKNTVALLLILLMPGVIFSQSDDSPFKGVEFQFGMGVTGQLIKLKKGQFSDPLIQTNKVAFTSDILNVSVRMKSDWVFSFFFQKQFIQQNSDFNRKFRSRLNERFSNKYFLPFESLGSEEDLSGGEQFSFYIGAGKVYAFKRFEIYPMLYLGVRSYILSTYTLDLKEKNSNRVVTYYINSNYYKENEPDLVTTYEISPAFKISYPLQNKLSLFTELRFTYFQTDIHFDETIIDLYTDERTKKQYNYDRHNSNYIITTGIIFKL